MEILLRHTCHSKAAETWGSGRICPHWTMTRCCVSSRQRDWKIDRKKNHNKNQEDVTSAPHYFSNKGGERGELTDSGAAVTGWLTDQPPPISRRGVGVTRVTRAGVMTAAIKRCPNVLRILASLAARTVCRRYNSPDRTVRSGCGRAPTITRVMRQEGIFPHISAFTADPPSSFLEESPSYEDLAAESMSLHRLGNIAEVSVIDLLLLLRCVTDQQLPREWEIASNFSPAALYWAKWFCLNKYSLNVYHR